MNYTGIGSRKVPDNVKELIVLISKKFAEEGHTLRSGGAEGCDSAFEEGCDLASGKKEIYVPYKNFGKKRGRVPSEEDILPIEKAYDIFHELAKEYGDFNFGCAAYVFKLQGRNMHQVLGKDLDDPVKILICYTPNGEEVGGTRWALRLAKKHGVKIINLGIKEHFDKMSKITK